MSIVYTNEQIDTQIDQDFENILNNEIQKKSNLEKWKAQLKDCTEFFFRVAKLLDDIYEVVPSANKKTKSYCLVPKGTADQVTYYTKPVNSLRVACTWNWRASMKKCHVREHIQCVTPDMPFVRQRSKENPDKATSPIYGNMVAIFDTDRKYHCLYGEKYDPKTKAWDWVVNAPERVALMMRKKYIDMQEAAKEGANG